MKKKLIAILCLIMLIFTCITPIVYGFGISDLKNGDEKHTTEIANAGNKVFGVVTTIGVVSSVVVLAILGVKYMLGSVEEKSQYKKSLAPYLIGATMVFTASTIAQIIYLFVK